VTVDGSFVRWQLQLQLIVSTGKKNTLQRDKLGCSQNLKPWVVKDGFEAIQDSRGFVLVWCMLREAHAKKHSLPCKGFDL
jgi:hypothetical protein